MNNEMITILEAYQIMNKPKIKEVNKTVVKEETSTVSTSSEDVSGNKETVKEAGEVASEPGSYVGFTGKIRTPGVYGTVENATFTIDDTKNVSWSKGTWLDGTWSGRGSFWNGGTWKNGTWKTGYWGGGTWENGIHQGGIFAGGTWKNGTWDFGVFDEGIWEDGVWKDGDWAKDDTKWIKGRDSKGVEHTDAPFHWGGMKYSKVTDPSKAAVDREKSRYNRGEYTQGTSGIDTFDDDDDPGKTYGNVGFKAGMRKADVSITDSVKKYVKSPIFKQIIDSLEETDKCDVKENSPDNISLDTVITFKSESCAWDERPVNEFIKSLKTDAKPFDITIKDCGTTEDDVCIEVSGTIKNIIDWSHKYIDIFGFNMFYEFLMYIGLDEKDISTDYENAYPEIYKYYSKVYKVSESFDVKEKLLEMIDKMSDEDIETLAKYVDETYFKI